MCTFLIVVYEYEYYSFGCLYTYTEKLMFHDRDIRTHILLKEMMLYCAALQEKDEKTEDKCFLWLAKKKSTIEN